jgi:hypothetical protein
MTLISGRRETQNEKDEQETKIGGGDLRAG